jgi:hypothetical protein
MSVAAARLKHGDALHPVKSKETVTVDTSPSIISPHLRPPARTLFVFVFVFAFVRQRMTRLLFSLWSAVVALQVQLEGLDPACSCTKGSRDN